MEDLESFKIHQTLDMTFFMEIYSVKRETKGTAVTDAVVIDSKDDFYFYQTNETKVTIDSLDKESIIVDKTAYSDGEMYLATESETDGIDRHIRGELSREKFLEYIESIGLGVEYLDCTEKSFEQTEDKEWLLKFSGYGEELLDKLIEDLSLDELDITAKDMEIEMQIDGKFRMKRVDLELICTAKKEKETPKVHVTLEYSDYNEATRGDDTPNPDDYESVDDILFVNELEDLLDELGHQYSGKFSLDVTSTFGNQSSKEYNTVTFGTKDVKFFYTIESNANGTKTKLEYKSGKLTVYNASGKATGSATQPEATAKETIHKLLQSITYDSSRVTDVSVNDSGVYTVKCEGLDRTQYQSVFASAGGSCKSVTQEISVTVTDGKIERIKSTIIASGTNNAPDLRITTTISFSTSI